MSEVLTKLTRGAALAAAAAGFAMFAVAAHPAHAQEPPAAEQPEAGTHARRRAGLLARLNLSPEQLQQLREIRRQSEEEARALAAAGLFVWGAVRLPVHLGATSVSYLPSRIRSCLSAV